MNGLKKIISICTASLMSVATLFSGNSSGDNSLAAHNHKISDTLPRCAEFKVERFFNSTVYELKLNPNINCKLELFVANQGKPKSLKLLTKMVSDFKAKEKRNVIAAINGSYFDAVFKLPVGELVKDHTKIIHSTLPGRSSVAYDGKTLRFGHFGYFKDLSKYEFVVTGGPRLLEKGMNVARLKGIEENFNVSIFGKHPRTAIGQSKYGEIILMVADGRTRESAGLTLFEEAETMKKLSAFNAISLDGGGSSEMMAWGGFHGLPLINNYIENSICFERPIANGIGIV